MEPTSSRPAYWGLKPVSPGRRPAPASLWCQKPRRCGWLRCWRACKYPKAVASLRRDDEHLLTFFDFSAQQWKHLRTSNVVESPFATARLRQRVTKGPGSRNRGLTMAFKLLEMAQKRWRRLNGAALLPLVREGATFVDGVRGERETNPQEERTAALMCLDRPTFGWKLWEPDPQHLTIPRLGLQSAAVGEECSEDREVLDVESVPSAVRPTFGSAP